MMPRVEVALRSAGLAACAVGWLSASACVVSVETARYSTRETKQWKVSGTPELTLITFDGSLEVRSWDKPEIRVEIEKQGADKAQADAIGIQADQSGDTIRLEATKPTIARSSFFAQSSPSAKLIAMVPRQCNLVARTGDGSITVERVDGRVDLDTGDGSLTAVDLAGTLRAHTGDGSMKFEEIRGSVDVDSGDGGGRVSGRLAGVRLRTGDGSLVVRAEDGSAMTDDWELRTGDGSIRVEVPEAFGATLDASTGDGSIEVEGFGPPTHAPGEDSGRRALRRDLGAAGKTLRARSGSGGITVRKI